MKKFKILIALGVILLSSIVSAMVFTDHGGNASLFYINVDNTPNASSLAVFPRGDTRMCALGFECEQDVSSCDFEVYYEISGIPVPWSGIDAWTEQPLPWRVGDFVDLHFDLPVLSEMYTGIFRVHVILSDHISGETIVHGSFWIQVI